MTMRRTILVGLVAILLSGLLGFGVRYWRHWRVYSWYPRERPDIQKVGGTVLVYEFDKTEPLDPQTMQACVEAVQRRLRWPAMAEANGNKQIAIVIPRSNDPMGDVNEVKIRMMLAGTLEFRILANELDDRDVFEDLQTFFADAVKDGEEQKMLKNAASNGLPPPVPAPLDGKEGWKLGPNLNREQNRATYAWIELARQQRWLLGLDNESESNKPNTDSEKEQKRFHFWRQAAHAREQGKPTVLIAYGSTLSYSRGCENQKLSEEQRQARKFEYFLLTRLAERDEETGEDLVVTGRDLKDAMGLPDPTSGRLEVSFSLNKRGADRMYRLTSQNSPGLEDNRFSRHMAIILDGQIVSAPTIQSAIRDAGRITGDFSEA
jgi:hypothetical protein